MSEDKALPADLFYLKSRDEIIDALPESVKNDKQKIQDELDFYPEKLRPFMGLTLVGKPIGWRYKGNNTDIFDISLTLQIPNRPELKAEECVFTLKGTWIDALSSIHKEAMRTMAENGTMGVFVPEPVTPVAPAVSEATHEEPEDIEDYEGFEETCMLYLKTSAEMGISADNFKDGSFTGNQYYPADLRLYSGSVLSVGISEWFEELETQNADGSNKKQRYNRLVFNVESKEAIIVNIPIPEDVDDDNPEILNFDYKNWISMFADLLEATGPVLADLIEAMKYLQAMGIKVEPIKEIPTEAVKELPTATEDAKYTPKEYGVEFMGVLLGPDALKITEEEFYSLAFKDSNLYPKDLIHMAGTVLLAMYITDDLCVVTIDGKQYDIPAMFVRSIEEPVEQVEKDPWNSLAVFDKEAIGKEELAEDEEFIFVKYPEVAKRIKARLYQESSANLISLLSGFVKIARLTLTLIDKGISSDFIIVTEFLKTISAMKLPVDLLDNLIFFQMDSQIEVYVVAHTTGTQTSGEKVDISFADDTSEDKYLLSLSDEFESDMNSGSGIRRLVLEQYPNASIIELRRI